MNKEKNNLSYIERHLNEVGFISKSRFKEGDLILEAVSKEGNLKVGPINFGKEAVGDNLKSMVDTTIDEIKKEQKKPAVFALVVDFTNKFFENKGLVSNSYIEGNDLYIKVCNENKDLVIDEEFLCVDHSLHRGNSEILDEVDQYLNSINFMIGYNMAKSEIKAKINVDGTVQDAIAKTLKDIYDEYGVAIHSIDVDWMQTISEGMKPYKVSTTSEKQV